MSEEKSKSSNLLFLLCLLPSIWLQALLLQRAWIWFVMPMSDELSWYPVTTMVQVVAFLLAVKLVAYPSVGKPPKDSIEMFAKMIALPPIILGILYVVHKMIEWGVM